VLNQLQKTIVMVGMMGAGKTAVGRALAARLNAPFLDSDAEIQSAANMSLAEIFTRDGEAFFRDKETKVIARLLKEERCVLSTGGGAFLAEKNRAMISRRGVAVWLRADLDVLWNRVRHKDTRPLLRTSDPRATLAALYTKRVPLYGAADLVVDSDAEASIEQMVDRVLALDEGTRLYLLAPIVRGRKGEYRKEIAELMKKGFQRLKIDGEFYEIADAPVLDKKFKHDIDVVIPIPESSRPCAMELAYRMRLKLREGFVKNRYIGRTFIMPGQEERERSVRQKLNPISLEFKDKNVLLVDDSIVRGTTSKKIIDMARDAGANKVYFASAAPPVRHPNVYGIDMAVKSELVAYDRTEDQIMEEIGADRLFYQNLKDLIKAATPSDEEEGSRSFDCSVFDGKYVTGDINEVYFKKLEAVRNDSSKHQNNGNGEGQCVDLYSNA
ncbi:MAG: shikimate kinase, partial [Anaerolineales bacterium]|nr:shikimate kinase [Anaerolineales bacterium]